METGVLLVAVILIIAIAVPVTLIARTGKKKRDKNDDPLDWQIPS